MELNPRLVSFRQWIAEHFYNDISSVMEQDEEKEDEEEEKAIVLYTDKEKEASADAFQELKQEENDNHTDNVQTDHISQVSVVNLTETLKRDFLDRHLFFSFNDDVWTMAKPIAEFLEFEKTSSCVTYHIDANDKYMFQDFPNNTQEEIQKSYIHEGTKTFGTSLNSQKLFILIQFLFLQQVYWLCS